MKLKKPLFPQLFKGIALFTPGGDLIYCIDPTKQGHWHLHLCVALQEILGLPEPPHFLVPGYTATIDRWIDPRTRQIRTSAEVYPLVRKHQMLLNAVFGTSHLVWQMAPWQEELCDPIVLETYRHQFPQLWEDHDLIMHLARPEAVSSFDRANYPNLQNPNLFSRNLDAKGSGKEDSTYSASKTKTSDSSLLADPSVISSKDKLPEPETSETLFAAQSFGTPSTEEVAIANSEQEYKQKLIVTPSDSQEISPDPLLPHTQGYVLRLFVSGHSAATEYTLMSLHQLLEHSLRLPYTLKVIDVFKHPDQAEANQISATPTLLRVWPSPVRKIVGDLTDAERILRILAVPED